MVAVSEQTVAVYALDDDSSFLKSTRRLLDSAGYKVETFTDPMVFWNRLQCAAPRSQ